MQRTQREWLETDGLGGFASGTISGRRTRRYHALLLTATTPPTGRLILVNGFEAQVTTSSGTVAISSQHYTPNVIHPAGDKFLRSFSIEPWPTWEYVLPDGVRVRQELFVPQGTSAVALRWSLVGEAPGLVTFSVRPLLSGRDYHALHVENQRFRFEHVGDDQRLVWHPYEGIPGTIAISNGEYTSEPLWYRQFFYSHEAERGLDSVEDLASPGVFRFNLSQRPAVCFFSAEGPHQLDPLSGETPTDLMTRVEQSERNRRVRFPTRLHFAADQFFAQRGNGQTIIAGYPWFTDWGRDVFIALRGLCLATGQLDIAGQILRAWAGTISAGMVPNRFPDRGETPEFNSVDASLWFIITISEYLQARERRGEVVPEEEKKLLQGAITAILEGYSAGTRYQIAMDDDGLLRAGEPGVQLTWMDAKVGDWVVTPRVGKPVEIQALWINALLIGAGFDKRWEQPFHRAFTTFPLKFWNKDSQCLFDVVDVNHQPDTHDASIRPNQILAAGGLPLSLLSQSQSQLVVNAVEKHLLTPVGLRTLPDDSPDYHPHYLGDQRARDAAYHQGTVWPWLTGAFVNAWLSAHGNTQQNREIAEVRFVRPLLDQLSEAGMGHISEIFDGTATTKSTGPVYIPRGCPFQAWSLGELLRLQYGILGTAS